MLTATSQDEGRRPWGAAQVALVVVCALIGGGAGFAFYALQTPVYESEASVLVLPTAGGLDSSTDGGRTTEVQIQTEAEVAHSAQVAADAATALGGVVTGQQLIDNSAVTTSPNSEVLVISFDAKTPELARDGAQALATAYLDRRSKAAAEIRDAAKAGLDRQLASLTEELNGYTDDLAAAKASGRESDLARAQANIAITQTQISDINSRLVALDVQTTQGGQIISEATLPASPTSPVLWIDVLAGVVLGGLVGSGLVLLMQRRSADAELASSGSSALASLSRPTTQAVTAIEPRPSIPPPPTGEFRADPPSLPAAAPAAAATVGMVTESVPPPAPPARPEPSEPLSPTRLDVLGSVEVDESGAVGGSDHAGLEGLVTSVAAASQRRGPLVLVGVDYPGLMTRAAVAISDAVNDVLGGAALVLTEPGGTAVAGRFTSDAPGLTNVLGGECAAADAVPAVSRQGAALMGPGSGSSDIPPATQRRRLGKLWGELANSHGTAVAQVQVPLDGALAQSVLQTAGPVLIVVKVGLSQQQDLVYAVEQLTWLGVTEHVVGIVTVSDVGGHAGPSTMESRQAPNSGSETADSLISDEGQQDQASQAQPSQGLDASEAVKPVGRGAAKTRSTAKSGDRGRP